MGERKVLNKYYPPDFDPSLLPRNKKPKDKQYVVRVMIPFSVCCLSCGEYMYRGKKFNARTEICLDESYLGISIHRFYIKCTRCSSELTFKTDPKNGDYACEYGGSRNFEPWRQSDGAAPEEEVKEADEKEDAMAALEARTAASKREMDILDALDESKARNDRNQGVDVGKAIADLRHRSEEAALERMLAARDEKELETVEFSRKAKRVEEEDDLDDAQARRKRLAAAGIMSDPREKKTTDTKSGKPNKLPAFLVTAKAKEESEEESGGGLGGLLGYGSGSGSDN